jgi:GntR family transcriptional repressor for pyruvate dehydrogenase complex
VSIDWETARAGSLTLTDSLAVAIERHIVAGRLQDGDRLPAERDLAARLGVSRGSLREALEQLEVRGVIERRRGRGTTVIDATLSTSADQLADAFSDAPGTGPGTQDALDALDVRACLEPSIAARAARRATSADLALLEAALREVEQASGHDDFAVRDKTFHRTIAHITHNPLLVRMIDRTRDVLDLSRREQRYDPTARALANEEHRAIFHAIVQHDPAAAFTAADAHLRGIRSELGGAEEVLD